jgi:hypothetical protein
MDLSGAEQHQIPGTGDQPPAPDPQPLRAVLDHRQHERVMAVQTKAMLDIARLEQLVIGVAHKAGGLGDRHAAMLLLVANGSWTTRLPMARSPS